jgi:predicted Zn-dependent protease
MLSSCIVELRVGDEVKARHICSGVESAIAISENALETKVADETHIYWVQAQDRQQAIDGVFTGRSAGFSYPRNRAVSAGEGHGSYRFTDELTRRRAAYAIEAISDAARQEKSIDPILLTSEYITSPYEDVPLEDQIWAKNEIAKRVAGQAHPRHPNAEIELVLTTAHRTNKL